MNRHLNIIGIMLICLTLVFPPACNTSSGGGGDDDGGTDSQDLTIIITFSRPMDTTVPAGIQAARSLPQLFGPDEAQAFVGLNGCLVLSIAAVLLTAVWLSNTQLKLVFSGLPAGSYSLTLNSAAYGCSTGFRTLQGAVLARIILAFTFTIGQIVYLNVQAD